MAVTPTKAHPDHFLWHGFYPPFHDVFHAQFVQMPTQRRASSLSRHCLVFFFEHGQDVDGMLGYIGQILFGRADSGLGTSPSLLRADEAKKG